MSGLEFIFLGSTLRAALSALVVAALLIGIVASMSGPPAPTLNPPIVESQPAIRNPPSKEDDDDSTFLMLMAASSMLNQD